MNSCSISLVVKNALLREGLCRILSENDFAIAQSIDNASAIKFETDGEGHVVILDHSLADKASPQDTVAIISRFRRSRPVVLADTFDLALVTKFFAAGACAYILNNVPYKTFLTMLQLVAMGESVVPSQFISSLNSYNIRGSNESVANVACRKFNLTDRDLKILGRLSRGLSNKMISRDLGVSEATVKVSVKNIFRKLSVSNRTQAAIVALELNGSSSNDTTY